MKQTGNLTNATGQLPPIGAHLTSSDDSRLGHENPFKLPSDDKIFKLREEEKLKRLQERETNKMMNIFQKSAPQVQSQSQRLKEIVGDDMRTANLTDALKTVDDSIKISAPRRQEKENMTEFVAKKRQMFLVQMSLDTKREEIRKLEEKAQMKEEALQRSEQMLEEDAMRFDAFLKENDKKAHDAIKKAEEETKKKQEKTQEIKRLTQQIQALSSEMSKHRESLDDCLRYKKFLDMLTPAEFFENHKRSIEERQNKIRQDKFDIKYKDWERKKRLIIEQHKKELEAKKEAKKGARGRRKDADAESEAKNEEAEEAESRPQIPPPPRLEDEPIIAIEEDLPMYFTEPEQLMDIFAALEEQNLFLIQNSQETERSLEELQHAFKDTKVQMESKTSTLHDQINELKSQIANEEAKVKVLIARREASSGKKDAEMEAFASAASGVSQKEKEDLLQELNVKVLSAYEQCNFDASSKPSTLFMLSQLESRLEDLLAEIDKMPVEYVIKAEKEKEKRRRERKREEQQALQEKMQEERNRRAVERSMQAPKKRIGRQVMHRSRPIRKDTHVTNDNDNDEGNDDDKYLS